MMSLIVRVTLGLDWAVSGLVWSRVAMVVVVVTWGVVSEGERGEAGGGCRGDANNAGVHQPGVISFRYLLLWCGGTWQMVELELEVLGHYQEMASRLIGQCIHTPNTTPEMGTLSATILRRKY